MKLKSGANQKKDVMYGVVAIILTVLLVLYLFWLARSLASRASDAFSTEFSEQKIPTFDFGRYDTLMQKITPSSTLSLPPLTKASSTASSTKR